MAQWYPDAAEIDLNYANLEKYLVKTSRIREGLESKRTVIVGPKGTGKTLLLTYMWRKRANDRSDEERPLRVPVNRELDSFENSLSIKHKLLEVLGEYQVWEDLWQTALSTSAVLAFVVNNVEEIGLLSRLLQELRDAECKLTQYIKLLAGLEGYLKDRVGIPSDMLSKTNPSNILNCLLEGNPSDINKSLEKTRSLCNQKALSINRPIDIYIDQTDQGINAYPVEIWKHAQNGLVGAIFRLKNQGQIKVFTSVRLEAWRNFRHEQRSQISGLVVELEYTDAELREIFENSIRMIESEFIHYDARDSTSAISAFLGMSTFHNPWTNDEEEVFSYILRHTLRRPRDFALLGREFHKMTISPEGASVSEISSIVNTIPAIEVSMQYFEETSRFFDDFNNIDKDKFYGSLTKNVFGKREMIETCAAYNSDVVCIAKSGGSCRDCHEAAHIFCDLYRVGLIGYVKEDISSQGSKVQKFQSVGQVSSEHLPESDFYFFHPSMDYVITSLFDVNTYSPVRGIRIGNGLPWLEKYNATLIFESIEKNLVQFDLSQDVKEQLDIFKNSLVSINDSDTKEKGEKLIESLARHGQNAGEAANTINRIGEALSRLISFL